MTSPRLLTYDMGPQVVAFTTTRHGGCSTGPYGAFNINAWCGDSPAHVAANRDALCRLLGIATDCLAVPHQVHQTVIRRIDTARDIAQSANLEGVDGVMTDRPGLCIGVSTADCIPVLLYDEAHHAACAVHAGWRGTVGHIARKAVAAMAREYGSAPRQLRACIGPGISVDSFEVGDEVYAQFEAARFPMEYVARRKAKWHIDLWAANRIDLETAGVCPSRVHVAGICTYLHADEFFSARRLGTNSGRLFTGILLKP